MANIIIKKYYTFEDLMKIFERSKYVTRLYIDRFAIVKMRKYINKKTKLVYYLNEEKLEEIKAFIKHMDKKNGYRKN